MKRFLAFLLILIVVAATVTPCCTTDDCESDLIAQQEPLQKANTEGSCSPFFSCATCSGFTSTINHITLQLPAAYHPIYFESYASSLTARYSNSPWQPPRSV